MPQAVLGLGSNLGARRATFAGAIALLVAQPGCRVLARSQLYATPPLGPPQPDYLNAAVRVDWVGSLEGLFALTCHIEQLLGRERRERWGPRTLDIDVLHWSEGALSTPLLDVPHRELGRRNFALGPLLDVAPELAGEWQPALEAAGGRPSVAQPAWLTVRAEPDGSWLTDWTDEPAELAALLVSAVVGCGPPGGRAHGVLPLEGPLELVDAQGELWLEARVRSAAAHGFAVARAAITSVRGGVLSGVLIGEHLCRHRGLSALSVKFEHSSDQGQRARVSLLRGA